jgi:hypothetical protein
VVEDVEPFTREEAFSFGLSRDGLPHLAYICRSKVVIERKAANGLWSRWAAEESHPANSPSLAFDLRDRPVVVYADEASGDIVYARLEGGEWTYETIGVAGERVGTHKIALAITPGGLPAMPYADQVDGGVRLPQPRPARPSSDQPALG